MKHFAYDGAKTVHKAVCMCLAFILLKATADSPDIPHPWACNSSVLVAQAAFDADRGTNHEFRSLRDPIICLTIAQTRHPEHGTFLADDASFAET
eukprot:2711842-Amphidinium_carterae.3